MVQNIFVKVFEGFVKVKFARVYYSKYFHKLQYPNPARKVCEDY